MPLATILLSLALLSQGKPGTAELGSGGKLVFQGRDLIALATAKGTTPSLRTLPEFYKGSQLFWSPSVGDRLSLVVNVNESGEYRLDVAFAGNSDNGRLQFAINGKNVGTPLNLYWEHLNFWLGYRLEPVFLKKGDNELAWEASTPEPRSSGMYVGWNRLIISRSAQAGSSGADWKRASVT